MTNHLLFINANKVFYISDTCTKIQTYFQKALSQTNQSINSIDQLNHFLKREEQILCEPLAFWPFKITAYMVYSQAGTWYMNISFHHIKTRFGSWMWLHKHLTDAFLQCWHQRNRQDYKVHMSLTHIIYPLINRKKPSHLLNIWENTSYQLQGFTRYQNQMRPFHTHGTTEISARAGFRNGLSVCYRKSCKNSYHSDVAS